jgi:exopolysaccharide biosynthesis polyprenyl glycosylphosphotransferase
MLKQQAKLISNIVIAIDIMLVSVAMLLAYELRGQWGGLAAPEEYSWLLVVTVPVWILLLAKYEFYASLRRRTIYQIVTAMINVHLLGGVIGAAAIYLLEPQGFSRGLYLTFVLLSFVLLTMEKVSVRIVLGLVRRRGYNYRNILIVGTEEKALHFSRLLAEYADWGLHAVGFVKTNGEEIPPVIGGLPVLGNLSELVSICTSRPVDEVVFCLPRPKEQIIDVESYLQQLEEIGVTVRMVLNYFSGYQRRREFDLFDDQLPMLTFRATTIGAHQLFFKRLLDIAGALVGLAVTALLLPVIACAIRRDSPGPIFFSQERIGENGRVFRLWKFRSMSFDAEGRKTDLLGHNEMSGAIFKIRDDPRITRVGKLLRQTSLDELPQFWNVLKGEMSLVGTRPPTPDEVAHYQNWHRRRLSIKPGITGLWQVSGRNQVQDFDEIVRLDLLYIDTWSFWLEFKILLRTLKIVLHREGSC